MSKRKKSVPQQLNKKERSDLQWDLSIPLALKTFEVIEAVAATPSSSKVLPKLTSNGDVSATFTIHTSVSPPTNAELFCLGLIPFTVVAPIESAETDWSCYDNVVVTVSIKSKLACIRRGDSVFPVSFGDVDSPIIRYLCEPCFHLKLDSTGNSGVQIGVYLSVENEKQMAITKGVMIVLVRFFPDVKFSYDVPSGRNAGGSRRDLATLYGAVKQHHLRRPLDGALPAQPLGLRPSLRQYQREALRWMLAREGPAESLSPVLSAWTGLESPCSPSGCSPRPGPARPMYLDRLTGSLSWTLPPPPPLPSGGILADEMGLGKTVEVLGLVLSNPRPTSDNRQSAAEGWVGAEVVGDGQNQSAELKDDVKINIVNGDSHLKMDEMCDEEQEIDVKPEMPVDGTGDHGIVEVGLEDVECKPEKEEKPVVQKRQAKTVGRKRRRQQSPTVDVEAPKPKKPSLMREAANRWYQDQLASTKRAIHAVNGIAEGSQPAKTFKCVCGSRSLTGVVRCQDCRTWQHRACVGVSLGSLPQPYFCPQCWQSKESIPSGATLIVSPSSICRQWETEIKKHVSDPAFSLLVYTGVSGSRYVQPTRLAAHTVVLMTYETLRKELDFADLHFDDTLRLRHAKRFVSPPSPLLCVGWWRVCLDEAQMAQSVGGKAFSMAQRLHAVHRWAVTGTPVTKSVSDLRGTLYFLGLPALADPRGWRALVSTPLALGDLAPLDALAPLLWRTAKADVADQINIPKQSESLHWVTFSAVEEFFYQRQQEAAETAFLRGLDRVCGDEDADNVRLGSLDRHTMGRVLAPLLRLRQACTHPGVARGNNISFQGSALTMEELLESLIRKAVVDCEDALRLQIAALNGLGAVEWIRGRPAAAASSYRGVLELASTHEGTLAVDRLQLIHALHNLADLLDAVPAGTADIPHTLRDHTLREDGRDMERQYMRRHHAQVESCVTALSELTAQVSDLELALSSGAGSWWRTLALALAARGEGDELSARLNDAYADANNGGLKAGKKAQRALCSSVHVMIGELGRWVSAVEESRDLALAALESLREGAADPETVAAAVVCHVRAGDAQHDRNKRNKKCVVCRCETQLKAYESLLFTMSAEHNKHELIGDVVILGQLTQGTWQASAHEIALKTLLALARSRREPEKWLGAGATHLKMLDATKKEFRRARALWTSVRDEIAARDELGLCRTKLRLRMPGEVVDKKTRDDQLASLHIIEPHDVEDTKDRLEAELAVAVDDLRRKRGQLGYLTTLRKRADIETNPDPCPICQLPVGNKWSVLPCGHVYCLDCLLLLGGHGRRSVRCAICREDAPLSAVTHVSLVPHAADGTAPTADLDASASNLATSDPALSMAGRNQGDLVQTTSGPAESTSDSALLTGDQNLLSPSFAEPNSDLTEPTSSNPDVPSGDQSLLSPNFAEPNSDLTEPTSSNPDVPSGDQSLLSPNFAELTSDLIPTSDLAEPSSSHPDLPIGDLHPPSPSLVERTFKPTLLNSDPAPPTSNLATPISELSQPSSNHTMLLTAVEASQSESTNAASRGIKTSSPVESESTRVVSKESEVAEAVATDAKDVEGTSTDVKSVEMPSTVSSDFQASTVVAKDVPAAKIEAKNVPASIDVQDADMVLIDDKDIKTVSITAEHGEVVPREIKEAKALLVEVQDVPAVSVEIQDAEMVLIGDKNVETVSIAVEDAEAAIVETKDAQEVLIETKDVETPSVEAEDVETESLEPESAEAVSSRVRGSHSAKVGAVVRCLLELRAADAAVKVLVFSTWDKVLDILEVALRQNSVLFERLKSGSKFQSRLEAFKTQARLTALLLPLRTGSKGLNLTEATHLVFVEPVLEPEFELQALGRIHRIGQTRETTIHRFLVRDSLEERIHAAVRADTAAWHDDKVTLGQLRRLFSVAAPEEQASQPLEGSTETQQGNSSLDN